MSTSSNETQFSVLDRGDAWLVQAEGDRGGLLFPTRQEAMVAAVGCAKHRLPSRIVLLSPSGAVEHEYAYPASDSGLY